MSVDERFHLAVQRFYREVKAAAKLMLLLLRLRSSDQLPCLVLARDCRTQHMLKLCYLTPYTLARVG